jgi:hypothetical protein
MPCDRARRPGPWLAVALAASLALSPGALGPATVAAQAGGPQVVIERPAPGAEVRGTVVVGGWAADTPAARGSGIAGDSVQAWLGAAGTGRLLDTVAYGEPRADIGQRLGNARFVASGFRLFWNSCDSPPGPNTLTVSARSQSGRTVSASVPIVVGSCGLTLGETVTGRIATGGQADEWTFEGTAGERVAITLDGVDGWDTLLELIAPDGRREDLDDDGGYDLNSWLSRRLNQTGTYKVVARPLNSEGCTGDYVALIWAGPPGSGPNSPSAALGTTAQYSFRGGLREFGERQSWTFDGEQGDELILYTTRSLGSRLDPFIELMGPDGQLIARDDDSGGGLNSFIQGVLPQSGAYTLVAQAAREDCGGDYDLRVEREWGEQSAVRGSLSQGASVSGNLSLSERRDVWSFPATAGERVTLMLDTNGPTRLQVAKPSGDWEQARSTRGQGLGLSFEPSESGTYQAVVFMDTSRPVSYTLNLEPGFGRLVAEKGAVPLGQPVNGEIAFSEARDLYTFQGQQGQQVRIALDRPGRSQLDPYLELLDPDGRTLAEDDDSGGELNSLIQVALPRTGTYTVVARGLGDSAGRYVLTVTLSGGGGEPGPGPSTAPTRPPGAPAPGPTPGTSPTPGPRPTGPPTR